MTSGLKMRRSTHVTRPIGTAKRPGLQACLQTCAFSDGAGKRAIDDIGGIELLLDQASAKIQSGIFPADNSDIGNAGSTRRKKRYPAAVTAGATFIASLP